MPESINASLIWENNSDTPLNAYNLSKTLDFQSESKFIYYTDDSNDYESWADVVTTESLSNWLSLYGNSTYVGKVIYHSMDHIARKVVVNNEVFTLEVYPTPYHRLLKIKSKTKISNDFTNQQSVTCYNSFEFPSEDKIFSFDALLTSSDFDPSSTYEIYLYYHINYSDYAQIKIVKDSETAWRTTDNHANLMSPSGYNIISYRKIGGFKTNSDKEIIEISVWDISTLKTEIIVSSLKKLDSGSIREFNAEDIPVADAQGIFISDTIESCLAEVKNLSDQTAEDTYVNNKFGIQVKFSPFKLSDSAFVLCEDYEITLKITSGIIDVYGERVDLSEKYLGSSTINVNHEMSGGNFVFKQAVLGSSTYQVYGSISGKIWRVFIDMQGQIYLKENAISRAKYMNYGGLKGWYDITYPHRCIGKFRVKSEETPQGTKYYIEKLSIVDTYEVPSPSGTLVAIHGIIAPDGLLPCDGYWHDINGIDENVYSNFPSLTTDGVQWNQGAWYEETPNLLGRGLRMPSSLNFASDRFIINENLSVSGGCEDVGIAGGNETHVHSYNHTHGDGTLEVLPSGNHTHAGFQNLGTTGETYLVQTSASGVLVSASNHTHIMTVSGGSHSHTDSEVSGSVESLTVDTGATNSWAPYKEVLICVKK